MGGLPWGIAITPDGTTAYVTNLSNVTPIDTATNTPGAPITVGSVPAGIAIIGGLFRASAAPAPSVSSISPNTGPSTGGTVVTITGQGFAGATEVDFGGTRRPPT